VHPQVLSFVSGVGADKSAKLFLVHPQMKTVIFSSYHISPLVLVGDF
jgi:hypothetical protein